MGHSPFPCKFVSGDEAFVKLVKKHQVLLGQLLKTR